MAWSLSQIPDERKGAMYKALASQSYAQVAVEFKIDHHYKDSSGYRNAVYRIAKEVEVNPEKYGVTKDIVEIVKAGAETRKANPAATQVIQNSDDYALVDFSDNHAVAIGGRNKMAQLLHKKMDMINNDKKQLEKVSLVQLTTAYGTLFDKAQIVQGQATENIAMQAKITKDLTPEEALEQLTKMREVHQEEVYEKK